MKAPITLPATTPLSVLDGPDTLTISFDDLLKYHGRSSIGGVAIAFRIMQAALQRLSPQRPIERRSISILTAFPGPGAADAFEMVTRARTDGRYRVDIELPVTGAAPAARGRYYFQFSTLDTACAFTLREDVVFPEFIDLLKRGAVTPLDATGKSRLAELKVLLAKRVLSFDQLDLLVELEPSATWPDRVALL